MIFDDKIKHLVLFDYGLLDKIYNKIKYLISKKLLLQIVLIMILEGSEFTHIILYLFKKILTFHNVINQLLIRIKLSTTIIYFLKKGSYKGKSNRFCLHIIMRYFDRIDVSEGTDVNKTSAPEECDDCRYLYFLNYSFKFPPNACNRCHDLLMVYMNLRGIAILNVRGSESS